MTQQQRIGNWMQTATGKAYWPIDPRPEDVFIEDIAHALSMICRYGGHSKQFYSVAEHSVHVSHLVPPEDALVALLHDASEAYCADVPRPLKGHLRDYKRFEYLNWEAIAARFGLALEMPPSVHDADVAMLFAEQKALMGPSPRPDWGMGLQTPIVAIVKIEGWLPARGKREFLHRFDELTARQVAGSYIKTQGAQSKGGQQ